MGLIKFNRNYEKYSAPAPSVKYRETVKPNITIASVLGHCTLNLIKDECITLELTAENYQSVLSDNKVDLVLIEKIWDNKAAFYDMLDICKKQSIPIVFWETKDDDFVNNNMKSARRFDYIFTVCAGNVDRYKKVLKSNNVFFLPFAVQPRIYNPVEKNIMAKEDMIDKSNIGLERLLGTINKVYSVNYNNESAYIPKEIFEMLASGIPVVSAYSQELEDLFPQVIMLYKTDERPEDIAKPLISSGDETDKLNVKGQRHIFSSHTYTNRINAILHTIGLHDKSFELPGVTMVTSTNRVDSMENIFRNYEAQNYKNKELIITLNNNKMDLGEWKSKAQEYENVKVFQIDEKLPLGRCLNHAVENSDYPYFSKCDDDNYYAPNFLSDLMNAYKYADTEIVGKLSYYCYLEGCRTLAIMCPNMEYRYVNMLSGSALIIKREVFEKVKFGDKPTGSDSVFLKECTKNGIRMYSSDRFNYVYRRHANQKNHTWKMEDEVFLKSCKLIDITDDFIIRVTV